MEFELHEINVTLSNEQKQKIRNAFINREKIRLRLTKDALLGRDTLLIPTRFFEEMNNKDGIDAVVGEQTEKEMRDGMLEDLKLFEDEYSSLTCEELKRYVSDKNLYKNFKKIKSFRDENLKYIINQEIWGYYGLFFNPAIDRSMKNKGIEFNLDYSLVNDLAKDFVTQNIEKLFECGANCH